MTIATDADRERFIQSLQSLPVVSLVLDEADMFGSQGLYNTPLAEGRDTERLVSIEYFDPAEPTHSFTANGGIRAQGQSSREFPKRSFRLSFRASYGTDELSFSLFGDDNPVHTFKNLVLRGGSQDG